MFKIEVYIVIAKLQVSGHKIFFFLKDILFINQVSQKYMKYFFFFSGLNTELSSKLEAIPFVDVGVVNIMFKGKTNFI